MSEFLPQVIFHDALGGVKIAGLNSKDSEFDPWKPIYCSI
jgi:hypothetical protein